MNYLHFFPLITIQFVLFAFLPSIVAGGLFGAIRKSQAPKLPSAAAFNAFRDQQTSNRNDRQMMLSSGQLRAAAPKVNRDLARLDQIKQRHDLKKANPKMGIPSPAARQPQIQPRQMLPDDPSTYLRASLQKMPRQKIPALRRPKFKWKPLEDYMGPGIWKIPGKKSTFLGDFRENEEYGFGGTIGRWSRGINGKEAEKMSKNKFKKDENGGIRKVG